MPTQKPFANWKNPSEYPNPKNANGSRWAWEFLRRNPQYQKDYEKYKNLPPLKERRQNTDFFECDPPAKRGESVANYKKRMQKEKISGPLKSIDQVITEKYSLASPYLIIDPEVTDPFEFLDEETPLFQTEIGVRIISGKYRKEHHWKRRNPLEELAVIDLNLPPPFLLKRFEQALQERLHYLKARDIFGGVSMKPTEKRATFHKYQNYLRVLDAKVARVKNSAIAEVLYPYLKNNYDFGFQGDNQIKNDFKAAKKLRDSDFRYLPFKDSPEKE